MSGSAHTSECTVDVRVHQLSLHKGRADDLHGVAVACRTAVSLQFCWPMKSLVFTLASWMPAAPNCFHPHPLCLDFVGPPYLVSPSCVGFLHSAAFGD